MGGSCQHVQDEQGSKDNAMKAMLVTMSGLLAWTVGIAFQEAALLVCCYHHNFVCASMYDPIPGPDNVRVATNIVHEAAKLAACMV